MHALCCLRGTLNTHKQKRKGWSVRLRQMGQFYEEAKSLYKCSNGTVLSVWNVSVFLLLADKEVASSYFSLDWVTNGVEYGRFHNVSNLLLGLFTAQVEWSQLSFCRTRISLTDGGKPSSL